MPHKYRAIVAVIFACLAISLIILESRSESEYTDDEYYDEYYEDGEEYGSPGQAQQDISPHGYATNSQQHKSPGSISFGFKASVGGGLIKIKQPLVDEKYVNFTADNFDCIKRVESSIVLSEASSTDEEAPDITQQVNDLRKKMEEVANIAAGLSSEGGESGSAVLGGIDAASGSTDSTSGDADSTLNGNNSTETDNVSDDTEDEQQKKDKWRKLSFREKQEIRMRERREAQAAREKIRPKFRLGADCESLICGSCKALVEEFGQAVYQAASNPKVEYVEDVGTDFCKQKEVKLKYVDMVYHVCSSFEQERNGYKDALILPFEQEKDLKGLLAPASLNDKKKKVCVGIGACDEEQFEFQSKALFETQEHWDEKCFVCQAFAADLEERVQLTRLVTERSIVPLVAGTCDRLTLDAHYHDVCKPLVQGSLLDDISWLMKVHSESVLRKARGEQSFPDKLCEEINWCEPWIDPLAKREKEAQETMEAVFF